ncbi:chromosome segregation ATPases,Cytochrome c biogenesis factor [Candidatus Vecturithrix granuli]|uniref:Chromosome segregation ATPases,Cytochrome c biogenesis factor n=1 Tax=Vecturithrix granuli TaxID=1499967 RepID=A0A081BV21_VECG1|nr:chromosome segregation ATPases,Cytochrome c biogenesis factor [Candidatus Vecturithrix granuli]
MYIYTQDSTTLSDRKQKRIQRKIEKTLHTLQNDPTNYKLHVETGELFMILQDYDKAEFHYQSAIALLRQEPASERTHKQMIMLYGKILGIIPNHREAHAALAQEYVAVGQKEKAYRFLLSSAKRAFEDENYELALQCYHQVLDIGKSNPHILERCSEMYLKLGRKQEAVDNYMHIGDLYAQEEKHVEALDYYKKAYAIEPENSDLLLKIARIYYAMEWTENAAAELVKLGEVHEKRQNFREALKYYQNSLHLDPENEKARAGAQRVNQLHTIDNPWEQTGAYSGTQTLNILEALDQLESLDGSRSQEAVAEVSTEQSVASHELEISTGQEPEEAFALDLHEPETEEPQPGSDETAIDSQSQEHAQRQDVSFETLTQSTVQPFTSPIAWDDHMMDLNLTEDFVLAAGLENQEEDQEEEKVEQENVVESPINQENPSESENTQKPFEAQDLFEESFQEDSPTNPELPGEQPVKVNTEIQFIPEESLESFMLEPEEQFSPSSPGEVEQVQGEQFEQLQHRIGELERQLQNTEEEKYFLQEQFTAQIRDLKLHEQSLKQEFEKGIDGVNQDKETLERRLEQITTSYEASRQEGGQFDEERYEAIIAKIQNKKSLLQQHLNTLLQRREENGRFLAEELKNLHTTKERLQSNITHIQHIKTQLEHKINDELYEAQQKILALTSNSEALQQQLQAQKSVEQALRAKFEKIEREKGALQDEYIETITALTGENEQLEHQLEELTASKAQAEMLVKKKFHALHQSYQQLRDEFKSTLESKEQELSCTAQRLSEFADKYVKLEKTLGDIRKERDKLDEMLARETATREMLQERLLGIEVQVDSLEVEGTELLEKLGEELDRQFTMKHTVSDEFQVSLEELERLLSLQEEEIQQLETLS